MKYTKEQLRAITGDFGLSLDVHPAKTRHPLRPNEYLLDADGEPVPLITDQACIRLDGVMIGYVMLDTLRISLTYPGSQMTQAIVSACKEMVEKLGTVQAVNVIAEPQIEELDEDDE